MATAHMNQLMQRVRRAVLLPDGAGMSDGQLLGWFVDRRDETAFAALVRRHGPMVWGVCRRVLDRYQDAEDAFQATFLVLVRKAASIRPREMLANWLHGVARQTSLKARAMASKRRAREKNVELLPEPKTMPPGLWCDLQPLLDQELSRLPDKYRVAIVLCDLEGKTRKEVARGLRLPEGTLSARLSRGRVLLAKRLSRHGLSIAGGAVAAMISHSAASASVPTSLLANTIQTAGHMIAGKSAAAGLSLSVAALTKGVLKTMLLSKLKYAATLLVVLGVSMAGGLVYYSKAGANDTPSRGQQGKNDVREAAIKALEQYAASKQEADRQLAIKALSEFSKAIAIPSADHAKPWDSIAARFKHRVHFEIGYTEFREGSRLEILGVWGTRPQIEVGGQYLVRGKYALPPGEKGKIYFYATASGAWGGITTTLDLQTTAVEKQEGEFELMHSMLGPGSFHLVLADPERYSKPFANVYFGTGENVWRKKP
jgi:RNA polymerase sigma factor (sigma-70 family)